MYGMQAGISNQQVNNTQTGARLMFGGVRYYNEWMNSRLPSQIYV
jgi:hypothetical protein